MEKQNLQDYIYKSLQSGMDPDEISQQLSNAGWTQEDIRVAFSNVGDSIKLSRATGPSSLDHPSNKQSLHQEGVASSGPQIQPLNENSNHVGSNDADGSDYNYSPIYEATGRKRGRIKTSFLLMKQTFKLLWYNKGLFWYPFMGALISLLVGTIFIIMMMQSLDFLVQIGEGRENIVLYLLLFIYYTIMMFIVFFYNTALTGNLFDLFKGESKSHIEYIRLAWSKKGAILSYSLITGTFGILIDILERALRKFNFIGTIIVGAIGFTWQLANTFTIPIIADSNSGAFQSIKKSVQLFRQRWGENLIGKTSFTGIALIIYNVWYVILAGTFYRALVFLDALDLLVGFFSLLGVAGGLFLLVGLYLLPFLTLERALTNTINAVLYYYAKTGQAPAAFTPEMLNASVLKRK